MLRRVILSMLLTLPVSGAWADGNSHDSFCHGYIRKALGEFPVDGLDRHNLWLAWNETVKLLLIEGELDQGQNQAGRDLFSQQLASNNVAGMVETSDEECNLGRNSTWVWW